MYQEVHSIDISDAKQRAVYSPFVTGIIDYKGSADAHMWHRTP